MAENDDRTTVKTYVPRYQKEIWADHAAELDMSQSEFVRTMVQSGRSDFDLDARGGSDETATASTSGDSESDSTLTDRVTAVLGRDGPLGWDELVDALTSSLEDDLEATLEELQESNTVRYSGRDGGYVVADE